MKSRRLIAVIGGHLSNTNPEALRVAEYTGRVLADLDLAVICGGEDGIMEAICRGCKLGGGTTFAVMKGNDKAAANAYIDYVILTSLDLAFMNVLIWSADGIIAFDGRYGTMHEMGLALDIGKPMIAIGNHELINMASITSPHFEYHSGYNVANIPHAVARLLAMIDDHSRNNTK